MENKGLLKKYNRGFRSCMKQTDLKGWLVFFFFSVFICWKDVALERTRNRRAMHEFKKHAAANLVNVRVIKWLFDWLIDWLTDWLPDLLTHRLSDWLTNWLPTDSLTDALVDWSSDLICECFILLSDRFLVWLTERLHNLLSNLFLQLARSFRFWQQLHGHCEVSRAHSQQRDQNQLRECFQEWRDYTLEIRADKYYVVAIQKKVWWERILKQTGLVLLILWSKII